MKVNLTDKILLCAIIECMLVLSVSLVTMFYAGQLSLNGSKALTYFSGGIFWFSFISEIILSIILSSRRKKYIKQNLLKLKNKKKKHPGFISIFSSLEAAICECIFIIGLISFGVCIVLSRSDKLIAYIILSITILSLQLRCLLTGKNYFYIKSEKYLRSEENG